MRVLVSGFQPFDHHKENSSQIITELLKDTLIPGVEIQTVILPVSFKTSFDHLKNAIANFNPDYVLCLGLANKSDKIRLEKVAINLIDCEIPDNEGVLHQNEVILKNSAPAYFSTLPLQDLRVLSTEFPMEISYSAGAYVCNYIMYRVLEDLKDSQVKAGFIHLPHLKNERDSIHASLIKIIGSFSKS